MKSIRSDDGLPIYHEELDVEFRSLLHSVPARERLQLLATNTELIAKLRLSKEVRALLASRVSNARLLAVIRSRDDNSRLMKLMIEHRAVKAARRFVTLLLHEGEMTSENLAAACAVLSMICENGADTPHDRRLIDELTHRILPTLPDPAERRRASFLLLPCLHEMTATRLSKIIAKMPEDESCIEAAAIRAAQVDDLALFDRVLKMKPRVLLFRRMRVFRAFVEKFFRADPQRSLAWLLEYMRDYKWPLRRSHLPLFIDIMSKSGFSIETVDIVARGECSKCRTVLRRNRELHAIEFEQMKKTLGEYIRRSLTGDPSFHRNVRTLRAHCMNANNAMSPLIVNGTSFCIRARYRRFTLAQIRELIARQRERFDPIILVCRRGPSALELANGMQELGVRVYHYDMARTTPSGFANDLFVLFAALHMGANAFVLNNDHFHEHRLTLDDDENVADLFRRWIATRCVTADCYSGVVKDPESIAIEPQQVNDSTSSWHVPVLFSAFGLHDEVEWMCVKKRHG